ncbi:ABC transporter ATP-binding protein [Cryobacterium glaciale]|uniref:ABC transporter ATP-binding protein n=1 Tax=Cryobacterium glaciale TaxID=1259145 RepID=A0A4R8V6Q8_9MICO|nr:ABC transporter ATP-binding protein [Cryobacterium glaciale]TFB77299.1 ABC transporter ATP-binding protein [Cryobacterium glaciale]
MSTLMLRTTGITKRFGGVTAVDSLDLEIFENEIVGLLGPNGAGKSTLFNLIAGALPPDTGRLEVFGEDVTGQPAHRMCQRGVARTFQIVRPLAGLTVLENAMVGAFAKTRSVRHARERAEAALDLVGLSEMVTTMASSLTLGHRKRLEVARALASQPQLLLLDEMMAGLNPAELDPFIEILRDVNRQGVTIIVVEHVVHAVMQLASRIVVISQGRKISEGLPASVMSSRAVVEAYLGDDFAIS